MRNIILVAALFLAACKTPTAVVESKDSKPTVTPQFVGEAGDGFSFKRKQFTLPNANVKMVYYKHNADLNAEYKKRGGKVSSVLAFSEYKDGFCEIHVIDPSLLYEPALVGHELMHCFHGMFHDPRYL